MFKLKKKAQSTTEYTVLIVIILGAFLATSDYVKRGLQGRWKTTVDDLGDQYDPRLGNTSINYTLTGNSNTSIYTINATNGFWTMREDHSNSTETKRGFIAVGAYSSP